MTHNTESSLLLGIFLLFGGFVLAAGHVPDWYIWLFWFSPFAWSMRALALNEFHSARSSYQADFTVNPTSGQPAIKVGDAYIDNFEIRNDDNVSSTSMLIEIRLEYSEHISLICFVCFCC